MDGPYRRFLILCRLGYNVPSVAVEGGVLRYQVKLFAVLKEKVGTGLWEYEASEQLKGSELLSAFFEAHEAVAGLKNVTRLAVNQSFCTEDVLLASGDEIALIPPVSGG